MKHISHLISTMNHLWSQSSLHPSLWICHPHFPHACPASNNTLAALTSLSVPQKGLPTCGLLSSRVKSEEVGNGGSKWQLVIDAMGCFSVEESYKLMGALFYRGGEHTWCLLWWVLCSFFWFHDIWAELSSLFPQQVEWHLSNALWLVKKSWPEVYDSGVFWVLRNTIFGCDRFLYSQLRQQFYKVWEISLMGFFSKT